MKTLYMLRHAKSSWKHDLIDHERPLKNRGNKDAALVSKYVANLVPSPQLIVSSDAVRALSTAQYFKEAFQLSDNSFTTNHGMYDFSGQGVMDILKTQNNTLDRIMIVGHNHAFTSIANMLGNKYIDNLPTCGFVVIEFDVDAWTSIVKGKTLHTVYPRDLK